MNILELCEYLEAIDNTSSRIEIREVLKTLFKKVNHQDIDVLIYLLQTEILRPYENTELNLGDSLINDAIARAYGFSKDEVESKFMEIGDLGENAKYFAEKRMQKPIFRKEISIRDLYDSLFQIIRIQGSGSNLEKVKIVSASLQNLSNKEAKYVIKIISGNLRVSLGAQTIIEAGALIGLEQEMIASYKDNMERFKEIKNLIEGKYNITYDLGSVIKTLITSGTLGLSEISIKIGIPIRSALCEREQNPEGIIKRLGSRFIVEEKYDGFRVQLHHKDGLTKMFSRRGEDISHIFPEFISIFKEIKHDLIIDSEAIGFDEQNNKFLNFQETIKRKRKYNIDSKVKEIPLRLIAFDIMYFNKVLINEPLENRRASLERLVKEINSNNVIISEAKEVGNVSELIEYFNKAISENLEGIIAKDLAKPYIPGARDYAWIKLKKNYFENQYDTYDLVIMGYKKGRGKNAGYPSRLICGIYDNEQDKFIAISGLGSGLSEENLEYFKLELSKIETSKKPESYEIQDYDLDVFVIPKIVVEVVADEVTRTQSGLSLRFPRFIRIRDDKTSEDTTTINELENIYKMTHPN